MIVLAIAGLILAIVFIAVPALQRNSRNNGRNADRGQLIAQFDTWVASNGGRLPSTNAHLLSIVGSTGWSHYNGNNTSGEPDARTVADNTAEVAATDAGELFILMITENSATHVVRNLPGRQSMHIWLEKECLGTANGILTGNNDKDTTVIGDTDYTVADIVESSSRAYAVVYQLEGEDNVRCVDNI